MISGHRDIYNIEWLYAEIKNILIKLSKDKYPIIGLSGMAIGADRLFEMICIELKIQFISYVPFIGQDAHWSDSEKIEYNHHLKLSCARRIICKNENISMKLKYLKRNDIMVSDCDQAIIVYDNRDRGGALYTLERIKKSGKSYIILNSKDKSIKKNIGE